MSDRKLVVLSIVSQERESGTQDIPAATIRGVIVALAWTSIKLYVGEEAFTCMVNFHP